MKRAACYVRVSTENQIENYSIEEQVERLKAYCVAKDWTLVKFYTDAGYSGGNINRPALQQLLADVKSNQVDLVVVYKLDRLSRSQKDTLTLIEDSFLSCNVDFVSMSENFDTSTAFGRAMIGILSVFAQLEKDQITERFTMGRIGRSKAGLYHGGSIAPTGYNYIDGFLIINDYEAIQVKEVFERFLSGESVNFIQNKMNEKYSGTWKSHTKVLYVLRNSSYTGMVKYKGEEHAGVHQRIISDSMFERTQELLNSAEREESKTTAQKTPFRAGYLLSSLIFCSNCNARYSANHGYYKCYSRSKSSKRFITDPSCMNENWLIEKLDNLVIQEIASLKGDKSYLSKIFESSEETPKENAAVLQEKLKEIKTQISKMIDLYQVGSIPIEIISDRINKLQSEKSSIEKNISSFESKSSAVTMQFFINHLEKLDSILEKGSLSEKRMFISTIIESIWIDGINVNIKWRI